MWRPSGYSILLLDFYTKFTLQFQDLRNDLWLVFISLSDVDKMPDDLLLKLIDLQSDSLILEKASGTFKLLCFSQ
jgi:hypothetical protein